MSRKLLSTTPLYEAIKKELKIADLTYRDVAKILGISENNVRLKFAKRRLSIDNLMIIAELLNMTMSELVSKSENPPAQQLTATQELKLSQNMKLLLVGVRILDGWSIKDIITTYDLTEAECIKHLLQLDRLQLIDLLPENVIRLRVRRGMDWQPDGALHRLIESRLPDFLNNRFNGKLDDRFFLWSRLTPAAVDIVHAEIRRFRARLVSLHEECKIAPADQLHEIVVLLAEREWELPDFTQMRRTPPASI